MMTTTPWKAPPELFSPPPRALRRKENQWGQLAVFLFLLPHTLVGVGVLLFVLGEPLLILCSSSVPGSVTELTATRGSKGGYTYRVKFDYKLERIARSATDQIPRQEYGSLHRGDTIAVHAIEVGQFRYATRARSFGEYARARFPIWIWALFWNAIVGSFQFFLWYPVLKARRLLRYGVAAEGRVTKKEIINAKSKTYNVHYSYAVDRAYEGKMSLTRKLYDQTQSGATVTVLYDASKPKRSVVYELSNYMVEGV